MMAAHSIAGSAGQQRQTGFNLVELMVAMVIGVFLIGGTLSVYRESHAALQVTERMARMQENARFAMQVIEQDIRAVGAWGQLNDTQFVAGRAGPADPVAFPITGDCGQNWSVNLDLPIEGTNNANPYAGSCLGGVGYMPDSDVLVLRHADEVDLPLGALTPGGLYLRSDQSHGEIFVGTTMPGGFPGGSRVNAVESTAYFVSQSSDGDNNLASLRRARVVAGGVRPAVITEEVISGVEDMQVQYGVDLTGDGSANSYMNADAVADMGTVVSVRIWLRMVTATAELGFIDDTVWEYADQRVQPSVGADTSDDAFRRTVVSKTIELRNRRIANQAGI